MNEIEKLLRLDSIEIAEKDNQPDEKLDNAGHGLFGQGGFRMQEVELQLVVGTPVSKGMDPQRAVGAAHDAGLAAPVGYAR